MLKLRRRSVLRGWMHLWSNPEGTFQTGNHLVELVPTWKHRLVTEDTVDVSVFCFCFCFDYYYYYYYNDHCHHFDRLQPECQ